MASNIFEYIIEQENAYKTNTVTLVDGWDWNMYDHVQKTFLYKNSKYTTGADDGSRPFKNIILPIAKLAYRAEGFDVKDIELYVDNKDDYDKSFIVKKYHKRWAPKKKIDAFIDAIVTTQFDYGGALVKKLSDGVELVPFQRLAFCDQTNIVGSPLAELHSMTYDEMIEMKGVWYDDVIDEVIEYSTSEKQNTQSKGNLKSKTTGKNCAVYEVRGYFPTSWLEDNAGTQQYDDYTEYSYQLHVVSFVNSDTSHGGVCLYKGKAKNPYKFLGRGGEAERIHGRALNRGGVEELFEPQIWINYSAIQLKEMLDAASLMILQTSNPAITNTNVVKDMEHGTVLDNAGQPITQVQFQPINETAFRNSINEWEALARATGSASESSLGVTPTSGTPFALEQLKTQNGLQEHTYQQGIIAEFVAEIYREWIIPMMAKDLARGDEWLDTFSLDDMQAIADSVVENHFADQLKKKLLAGEYFTMDEATQYKSIAKQMFFKNNKKFIKIMDGEIKNIPIAIQVNIAGKQSYLSQMTDKLSNVFKTVIQNPDVLKIPQFAKIFNQILESSGMSAVDFETMNVTEAIPEVQQEQLATA